MADKDDFGFEAEQETPSPAPATPAAVDDFGFEAEAASSPAPVPEPSFLDKAGAAFKEYSPLSYAYGKLTGDSSLGQGVQRGLDTANAFGENLVKGASLGAETPLNYVKATGNYLEDALTPGKDADFSGSLKRAEAETKANAAAHPIAAAGGQLLGTVGSTLATGGLGAAKLGAAAGKTAASSLGKLGITKGLGLAAGATALVVEGATEGALGSAIQEIDQTAQKGDWRNLGEKLYTAVPQGAFEGAKWNTIIGGGTQLGLKALGKAKAAIKGVDSVDDLALKVGNSGDPNVQTAGVYDPNRPLRASEIVDQGTEEAIAARSLTTPEVAQEIQQEALPVMEKDLNRMMEIKATLDHKLRKAAKREFIKEFTQDWTGPSFDEMLAQNGLSDEILDRLAKNSVGEGASGVRYLQEKIKLLRSELPSYTAASKEVIPGKVTTDSLGFSYSTPDEVIETAAKGRKPTVGEMANALDDLKGVAQKVAAKRGARGYVHEALLEPTEALRRNLEDATIWPEKFAESQKAVNQEWSADIRAMQAYGGDDAFAAGRASAEAVGGDPYHDVEIVKQGWLKNQLATVGAGGDESLEESFRARLRASELSFGERLRWGGADEAGNRQLVAEYAELGRKVENNLNRVALANRYAAKNAATQPLTVGEAGKKIGMAVAESVPLAGGALRGTREVRSAWKAQVNADTAGAAFQLKKRAAQAQLRMNKAASVKRFIEKTSDTAKKANEVFTPAYILHEVPKKLEQVDKLADPDSDENKTLSMRLEQLEEAVGPELASAYEEQIQARNDFLLEKAGPPPEPTPFGTPKRDLDEETQTVLARYIAATDDPLSAIERLSIGEHSAEDLETLETLYPSMLQEWRAKTMDRLADLKSPPSYDQQQELASILGIPDDTTAFWQQFAGTSGPMREEQKAEMGNGKLKVNADNMKAKSDRLG